VWGERKKLKAESGKAEFLTQRHGEREQRFTGSRVQRFKGSRVQGFKGEKLTTDKEKEAAR